MPPNLEEFIPGEHLPDIIDVYVSKEFLIRITGSKRMRVLDWPTSQVERPIKFVRQYPECNVVDKGMFNTP